LEACSLMGAPYRRTFDIRSWTWPIKVSGHVISHVNYASLTAVSVKSSAGECASTVKPLYFVAVKFGDMMCMNFNFASFILTSISITIYDMTNCTTSATRNMSDCDQSIYSSRITLSYIPAKLLSIL